MVHLVVAHLLKSRGAMLERGLWGELAWAEVAAFMQLRDTLIIIHAITRDLELLQQLLLDRLLLQFLRGQVLRFDCELTAQLPLGRVEVNQLEGGAALVFVEFGERHSGFSDVCIFYR